MKYAYVVAIAVVAIVAVAAFALMNAPSNTNPNNTNNISTNPPAVVIGTAVNISNSTTTGTATRIQGTVATGLPVGTCPNLHFIVVENSGAAQNVTTSGATQFINGACAAIGGALQVQVTGVLSNGVIAATSVQSQDFTGG